MPEKNLQVYKTYQETFESKAIIYEHRPHMKVSDRR